MPSPVLPYVYHSVHLARRHEPVEDRARASRIPADGLGHAAQGVAVGVTAEVVEDRRA